MENIKRAVEIYNSLNISQQRWIRNDFDIYVKTTVFPMINKYNFMLEDNSCSEDIRKCLCELRDYWVRKNDFNNYLLQNGDDYKNL